MDGRVDTGWDVSKFEANPEPAPEAPFPLSDFQPDYTLPPATLAEPSERSLGHIEPKQKFGEAFARARGAGLKVFEWGGKSYSTETREEAAIRVGGKAKPVSDKPAAAPADDGWSLAAFGVQEPSAVDAPGALYSPKTTQERVEAARRAVPVPELTKELGFKAAAKQYTHDVNRAASEEFVSARAEELLREQPYLKPETAKALAVREAMGGGKADIIEDRDMATQRGIEAGRRQEDMGIGDAIVSGTGKLTDAAKITGSYALGTEALAGAISDAMKSGPQDLSATAFGAQLQDVGSSMTLDKSAREKLGGFVDIGNAILSNPKGFTHFISEQAPNFAAMTAGNLIGWVTGGPAGARAGQAVSEFPLEFGSQLQDRVGKSLNGREATRENVLAALNENPNMVRQALTKAIGTTFIDSVTTVAGQKVAADVAAASAVKARRALGNEASASDIAFFVVRDLARNPMTMTKAVGNGMAVDTAGAAASEIIPQKVAYGEVDAADVIGETLLEPVFGSVGIAGAAVAAGRQAATTNFDADVMAGLLDNSIRGAEFAPLPDAGIGQDGPGQADYEAAMRQAFGGATQPGATTAPDAVSLAPTQVAPPPPSGPVTAALQEAMPTMPPAAAEQPWRNQSFSDLLAQDAADPLVRPENMLPVEDAEPMPEMPAASADQDWAPMPAMPSMPDGQEWTPMPASPEMAEDQPLETNDIEWENQLPVDAAENAEPESGIFSDQSQADAEPQDDWLNRFISEDTGTEEAASDPVFSAAFNDLPDEPGLIANQEADAPPESSVEPGVMAEAPHDNIATDDTAPAESEVFVSGVDGFDDDELLRQAEAAATNDKGDPDASTEMAAFGREGQSDQPQGSQADRGTGGRSESTAGDRHAGRTESSVGPAVSVGDALPGSAALAEEAVYPAEEATIEAQEIGGDTQTRSGYSVFSPSITSISVNQETDGIGSGDTTIINQFDPVDEKREIGDIATLPTTNTEAATTLEAALRGTGNPAIDLAAHAAASSPLNAVPEPTEAQKKAGNYAVGRVRLHGMDISIENPAGSIRSGTDSDGERWETEMQSHYGYIRNSTGRDKDHIDVFLSQGADTARTAWVIDQINQDGTFDEHKIVIGPDTEAEARDAYLANYDSGWMGLGAITPMAMDDFKTWVFDKKKTRKPVAYKKPSTRLTAHDDPRIAQYADTLRELASQTGWAQTGGRIYRNPDTGEVDGRTAWIPNAEWYPNLSERLSGGDAVSAVEAAISGASMSVRQKRFVSDLLDVAESYANVDTEDHDPDSAAEAAAERAAIQATEDLIVEMDDSDLDALIDAAWNAEPTERRELSDEEIDELFGAPSEEAPGTASAEGAVTVGQDEGDNRGSDSDWTTGDAEEVAFDLTGQTQEQARAEEQAIADAKKAEQDAADKAEAEAQKARIAAEVASRQQASAENFVLGQDAEDALAGQGDIFGGLTQQEATNEQQSIEQLREKLRKIEGKILLAAGERDNIEQAMSSRKVGKSLKDERNAIRDQVRTAQKRLDDAQKQTATSTETPAGQPAATTAQPAQSKPESVYGTTNTLVTKDRAAELRAKLKSKLGQVNSGIDPEILAIGAELAAYHIEAGARSFGRFAQVMAEDLGASFEKLRPYLRSWFNGARDMLEDAGRDVTGIDGPDVVRAELARMNAQLNKQANALPDGWTEATPGGMAANNDPVNGGIVDSEIVSGKWFAIPNNDAITKIEGMDTRADAFAALQRAIDKEQRNEPDQRSNTDMERNRQDAGTQDGMGEEGIRNDGGRDDGLGEQGIQPDEVEARRGDSQRVPGPEAAAAGAQGDFSPFAEAPGTDASAAGIDDDSGSGSLGFDGQTVEPAGSGQTDAVAQGGLGLASKRKAQREAASIQVVVGDRANIAETLPFLMEGQKDDVAFAEKRFSKPTGYGVLFTNGTGTGKTATGLGIIKRFERQGKNNILIVVPSDKIKSDWVTFAKNLQLDVTELENTQDAGKGIVITTYANFGMNDAIVSRKWDLVVTDESHKLMQAKDGGDTQAIDKLRAITMHKRGSGNRAESLHGDILQAAKMAADKAKSARMSDDQRDWANIKKFEAEEAAAWNKWKEVKEAVDADVEASQGASRPRTVFLSATPFAYEKTVDYAEGFLFDYPPDGRIGNSNQGGFEKFMVEHFGYRIRYHKLTEPGPEVNRGLMQRQFNSWLKAEGVLSGRMLDVEHDYDRKFVLLDSAIGAELDSAMQWIWDRAYDSGNPNKDGYSALNTALHDKFDHLARRYLLEAIKAKEVIPIIRQHLDLGRKVVVFHDFKNGGGFNPFRFSHSNENADNDEGRARAQSMNSAIDAFNAEFRDLIESPMWSAASPLIALTNAFPGALLFNGDVSPKERRANVTKFQEDASGPQLIVVQSAAGKEGISLHDTTGKHQRVLINLGLPTQPTTAIQQEGRIFRVGQASNAIFRYLNTGTNWERFAFATSVAQRASAAENLAVGEEARALMDAFIDGFEESDTYAPGHEGEGTGGKARDKAANQALTEWDRAMTMYWAQTKRNSRTKAMEGVDYFATPEPLGLKMVEWADIRDGDKALEPSAGHGAIARWLPDNISRTVVEPSSELASRLKMVVGDSRLLQEQFEALDTAANKFDAIVMNPPFGSGGSTAIQHVAKAAKHLNNGGRIVALIPTGPSADKKFEKWFYEEEQKAVKPIDTLDYGIGPQEIYRGDTIKTNASWAPEATILRKDSGGQSYWVKVDGRAGETTVSKAAITAHARSGPRTESFRPAADLYLRADIKLPQVTFERAGTRVAARVVVIEKQTDKDAAGQIHTVQRDYSDTDDIKGFFERIKEASIPAKAAAKVSEAASPAPTPTQTAQAVQGAMTGFKLAQTKHAIKGIDLYVATIEKRVEYDEYTRINGIAKKHNGYYSKFDKNGAIPGFQFETEADRTAFLDEFRQVDSGASMLEPSAVYTVNQDGQFYENDLFGNPLPDATRTGRDRSRAQAAKTRDVESTESVPVGRFGTTTKLVTHTTRDIGANKVTTVGEAATALAYLGRGAVERFDALITDKAGKPLALVGSFKGAMTQTSVFPSTVVAEAIRIPGAAHIWFAHNHPSGTPELSSADRRLTAMLEDVFDGSGIKTHGTLALTHDGKYGHTNNEYGTIKPTTATLRINAVEREIDRFGKIGAALTSPDAALNELPRITGGESGLVLTDAQNFPIAFVPMAPDEALPLKGNGRLDALYRAMSYANATGAILYDPHSSFSDSQYRNIGSALVPIDVRMLDVIQSGKSLAGQGMPLAGRTVLSRAAPVPWFSPLHKAVQSAPDRIFAKGAQVKLWLVGNKAKLGLKDDEIQWSGINDYLDLRGKDKVTKAEVLDYLSGNGVAVQDVVKGAYDVRVLLAKRESAENDFIKALVEKAGFAESDARLEARRQREDYWGAVKPWADTDVLAAAKALKEADTEKLDTTKFSGYWDSSYKGGIPGTYREILVTLPAKTTANQSRAEYEEWARRKGYSPNATFTEEKYKQETGKDAPPPRTMSAMAADEATNFKSSHWDEPNVLVHVRLDEVTGADGKRYVRVGEIQSDWGQSGKKHGFAEGETARIKGEARISVPAKENPNPAWGDLESKDEWAVYWADGSFSGGYNEESAKRVAAAGKSNAKAGAPTAPFVTDTKSWVALGIKRAIIHAAQVGADGVVFGTGQQNADLYDLSKTLQKVTAMTADEGATFKIMGTDLNGNGHDFGTHPVGKLDDVVGKELAEKIASQKTANEVYAGNNLKVGGEGMRAFYDKIVPSVANEVLRKIGGGKVVGISVRATSIEGLSGEERRRMNELQNRGTLNSSQQRELEMFLSADAGSKQQQPGFTLSEELRAKIDADGLPLFSRQSTGGMALRDLKAVAARVQRANKNMPTLHVLASPENLDRNDETQKRLYDFLVKNDALKDVEGATHEGEIYVFASGVADEFRAEHILAIHEPTHYGLRSVYGHELDSVLQLIYASNATVRQKADALKRSDVDSNVGAVEEVLADMTPAELVKLRGWRRLVKTLRDWFREHGFTAIANRLDGWLKSGLTDQAKADLYVADVVNAAREWVKNGKRMGFAADGTNLSATRSDTITVDGVERPRTNSNGKPIANSDEAIRKFYAWFGNSAVVDEQGRPLVVYHSSLKDIEKFNRTGEFMGHTGTSGISVTDNPDMASRYLDRYGESGWVDGKPHQPFSKNVMALYVKAEKPLYRDEPFKTGLGLGAPLPSDYVSPVVRQGYDALIRNDAISKNGAVKHSEAKNAIRGREIVVFDPKQLKSASGNSGDFSPTDPNISLSRRGQAPGPVPSLPSPAVANKLKRIGQASKLKNFVIPPETGFRQQQRIFQDSMNRFTVIQDWLAEQGVADLPYGRMDVYRAEERMHGKIASRIEDFREKRLTPLIKRIHKAGFEMDQVAEYLHANHAIERNEQIERINKAAVDVNGDRNGSGMTDAEAAAVLSTYQALPNFSEFEALAEEVRSITDSTKRILLGAGIISQDQADAWDAAYKHYVPLRGNDEGGTASGKGLSVNAKSEHKRAMGHGERESGEWIVENIIHAHERAIYLAEKNVVGKHLLTLAASVPNADLWTVSKPAKRGVIMPGQVAFAVAYKGNVVASFNTKAEAESFVNQSVMSNTARAKSNYTVNRTVGDPQVVYMASGQLADNEVQVYVKGHAVRIQLIDPLLANAYKRLGQENLTGIMALGRDINNFLSRAYTGLAPEFIVTNVQRDLLSGMVNILGEEGATVAARSLKNWPEAMYRMSRFSVTGNGDPWFNSYRESGGSTGGAYIGDLDRIGREVQATYDEAIGVFRMFRENRTGKASLLAAKKLLHIFTFWIEHMNAAAEGGMRLAAYRAKMETEAKRLGVTADVLRDEKSLRATVARNRAASLAKNSTVNFNRKGEKGAEINANFLFYNAAVQGSAIMAHALAKGKHKGQAWTALATLTGLAALLASQFGDDEWEEIPQHEKDRNMLIKLGDTGYVAKYSVPYGHGLAFAMGNSLHDLSQGKAAGAVGYHMASAVFENLMPRNPLGEDAKSLEDYGWTNFVPEGAFLGVKWWSNIGINRDGFGRQIMPESKYDETQPDHLKMYSTLQGSIYDKITSSTNKATGGTDTQAGSVDVSPETLQFLFESITGGLGRFAVDEANVAKLAAQGSAPEVKEVPVVRKFARERNRASDARSEFWETLGKAEDYIANRTRAVKGNDSAALERMERGHAELSKWVNTYKDDATAIRDDINEKRNDDTLSAAKKREAIREIETSSVDTFRKMRHRLDDEMDLLKE